MATEQQRPRPGARQVWNALINMGDMNEIGQKGLDLLMNPRHNKWVAPALLVIDAVLCALIIRTVNYTEIDWRAYMQQVEQWIDGERDYTKIEGQTGPLVYPAIHVYIYYILHEITRAGQSILLAQVYFAFLYIINLGLVMACYVKAQAPPFIFPLLILSKRLHSIYVLRCFNDCWAVGFLFLAIYFFQNKDWHYGCMAYGVGVGVKMSLLLAAPPIIIIVFQANGFYEGAYRLSWIGQAQLLSSLQFLRANFFGYLSRAYQFSRVFNYQWTVNWKFVSEETFLSKRFSYGLIALHLGLLGLFAVTRWFRPLGRSPRELARLASAFPSPEAQKAIIDKLSSDFVMTSILSSMAIGMLCARSLHYQFFAYIAWATPFLLWKAKMNPVLIVIVWLGQELAWNRYPADELSSKLVVGILAVQVIQVWVGTEEYVPTGTAAIRKEMAEQEAVRVKKVK